MRLHQFSWLLWFVGTAIILGSWMSIVSPPFGWVGFAIAGVGSLLSYIPARNDPSHLPLTQEGFPVEPSGAPVSDDMHLASGTPLLANSQGKWWRATVISVEENGDVLVTFPGWDPEWARVVPRKSLQIDPDPTRAPIALPEDPLLRWRNKPAAEDARTTGRRDGVRE